MEEGVVCFISSDGVWFVMFWPGNPDLRAREGDLRTKLWADLLLSRHGHLYLPKCY